MRLRNNPNAMHELKESKYFLENNSIKLDSNTILEIGMGKGEMITQLAFLNPNKNFVGVEKFATVAHKAMKRAETLKLNNFSIIVDDIVNLPEKFDGKIKTIWLTFSDPWPKARHAKRRLTYKSFLQIYKDILDDDGVIKFKTDNDKLFEWTKEHMIDNGWKLSNITNDFHNHPSSSDNVMTGYEIKWSNKGKRINYLEARI